MHDPGARRLLHVDLEDGLPPLSAEADGLPLHVVWWWHGVPIGHDEIAPRGLPPRVLADRAAARMAGHEPPGTSGGPEMAVAILSSGVAPLAGCEDALLDGTAGPAEIVVVDRSPRGSAEAPASMRVIAAPGASPGAAANLAVAATESEVLAFLDDGATLRPGWLGHVRAPFADDDVVAVAGPELPAELATEAQLVYETLLDARSYRLSRSAVPPTGALGAVAMRRRALELAAPFDERIGDGAIAEGLARALARGGVCAFTPGAAVVRRPPPDRAGLRRRARERRRVPAAAAVARGEPAAATRRTAGLAAAAAREGLRRAAGASGVSPRSLPRPAGAELLGHLEGVARAARRGGAPAPRHKAPLREYLARNPFPHPYTEGFFYREKMRAIHRVTPDVRFTRVLEIGGGRSGMARKLLPAAHVTSTDLDPAHADAFAGDSQTTFRVADATALPFDDGEFDAVTLFDVLEHIPDDAAAAREAWRVVRPGGWVIVSSPNLRWRSPYHAVMRPICPSSEDMIARWEHVRVGYERDGLTRLFGAPPAATADFINPVTVVAHDLAFSHLPSRVRRVLLAGLLPVTWAGYALQGPRARGTETAASWRKPAR
jgi:SAM-dependent methyltransferase